MRSVETAPGTGARAGTLSRRLREETSSAHVTAETAFGLERRLATPRAYGDGLVAMAAFHDAWAPALALVAPRLPPGVREGASRRRLRLRDDLLRLGRADELGAAMVPGEALPATVDGALGAWYVLEGAALGGLVIAAQVRRRLPEVLPAVSYFAGEGSATAARWRQFTRLLDGWAPGGDHDGQRAGTRVVEGALTAFAALTARFGELA